MNDDEIIKVIELTLEQLKYSYNEETVKFDLNQDDGVKLSNGDIEEIINTFNNLKA